MMYRVMSSTEPEYIVLRRFVRCLDRAENPRVKRVLEVMERELTSRQREMVYLYYVEQFNMSDIAKLLGINISTVSRTLSRSREKLHGIMSYAGGRFLEEECGVCKDDASML